MTLSPGVIDAAEAHRLEFNYPSLSSMTEDALMDLIKKDQNKKGQGAGKPVRPQPQAKNSNITSFPTQKADVLAAAGPPIPILSEVEEWDDAQNIVRVRICGISMSPKLDDGDVIEMKHRRVSRNPFMKKGLIYLVEYDGGFTVKRYNTRPAKPEEMDEEWVEHGRVKVLESLNPAFEEIIIKQPLDWVAWLDEAAK